MKVSIMQPNVFMWPGLLVSILSSDLHIVLDTVLASKNARYNRNLIAGSHDKRWLAVPFSNFSRHLLLKELTLNISPSNINALVNIFSSRYSDAQYVDICLAILSSIADSESDSLSDVYRVFLSSLGRCGFQLPEIVFSSDLNLNPELIADLRGADLIDLILKEVGATTYLAAQNVRAYSTPQDYLPCTVMFQHFMSNPYDQFMKGRIDSSFIPCLSVLDVIASIGVDNSISYMDKCNSWLSR